MKDFKKECVQETQEKNIKFEENRKSILFKNANNRTFIKVQVDGCQIIEGERCDNLLVNVENGDEYFIELKGTDVGHALQQLDRSLEILSDKSDKNKKVSVFIISANVSPKLSTKIQTYKKKWERIYNTAFKIQERRLEVEV
jgi:hypothetical protein